jgi:hypothetical protein
MSSIARAGGMHPRQPEQPARRRDDPAGHLRQAELRVGAGDDEVAGEHQLGPAGQGEAPHGRDHRLGPRVAHEPAEAAASVVSSAARPAASALRSAPAQKFGPGAGQQRDPGLVVLLEAPHRRVHRGRELGADRVALVRAG